MDYGAGLTQRTTHIAQGYPDYRRAHRHDLKGAGMVPQKKPDPDEQERTIRWLQRRERKRARKEWFWKEVRRNWSDHGLPFLRLIGFILAAVAAGLTILNLLGLLP